MLRSTLALTLLACGVAAAPASAATTLKLHDTQTKVKEKKSGVVVSYRVTDRKTKAKVGTLKVDITFKSPKRGSCTAKLKLDGGTIDLRCNSGNLEAKTVKGKVTGGTGDYADASGTFTDTNTSETEDDLTIKLD